jgi:pyruvate kinase
MRKTKIVATIGPATDAPESIAALLRAGMNVARLNMSHGSHAEHARRITELRAAAASLDLPLAILLDLQGPKIRTGTLREGQPVRLEDGAQLTITTRDVPGSAHEVGTTYAALPQDVRPGDRLLISDGLLEMRVEAVSDQDVLCRVVHGGLLREHQGINLPGVPLSTPAVTDKDLDDLAFGLAQRVDYVAISFVRRASDVTQVRDLIARQGHDTPVIAKLEKPEAVDALDEILKVCDGVMVARGDMGVEMAPEMVPAVQKEIIRKANRAGRPVITATQMLQSMIDNPQPTRAEVSDVANAIIDGSDAVMLSGETAIGRYPIASVEMMARIAIQVEEHRLVGSAPDSTGHLGGISSMPQAIAAAVSALVTAIPTRAICVVTKTGNSARLVSHQRPAVPILGFTPLEETYQRLSLMWGVIPLKNPFAYTEEEYYHHIQRALVAGGYAREGELVVVTGGHPIVQGGPTNFVKIMTVTG